MIVPISFFICFIIAVFAGIGMAEVMADFLPYASPRMQGVICGLNAAAAFAFLLFSPFTTPRSR